MIKPIGKLRFSICTPYSDFFENSTAPARHLKSGGSFYQYSLIMLLTSKILSFPSTHKARFPYVFLSLSPLRSQAPLCPSWRFSVRLLQYSPYVPRTPSRSAPEHRAVFNLHPKEEFIFLHLRNLLRQAADNMYSLSVRCIRIQYFSPRRSHPLQPRLPSASLLRLFRRTSHRPLHLRE